MRYSRGSCALTATVASVHNDAAAPVSARAVNATVLALLAHGPVIMGDGGVCK